MPALFALGQHPALRSSEMTIAFLDDVYVVCSPDRVSAIFGFLQNVWFLHPSIRVHHGKTRCGTRKVWCHMAST